MNRRMGREIRRERAFRPFNTTKRHFRSSELNTEQEHGISADLLDGRRLPAQNCLASVDIGTSFQRWQAFEGKITSDV
jgi:hypothetical protein